VHLRAYSKLLLASQQQVLGLLAEERMALQSQLSQEKDDPQSCFIQSALLQLQVHMHSHRHMNVGLDKLLSNSKLVKQVTLLFCVQVVGISYSTSLDVDVESI